MENTAYLLSPKRIIALTAVTLTAGTCVAQQHTISGHVVDQQTGEPVLYANCAERISGSGCATNGYGYFSLTSGDKAEISISCLGYQSRTASLSVRNDTTITLLLAPKTTTIGEVRVSSNLPEREQVLMGKNTVPVSVIKSMPSLLGEPDLLRALSFLPGVSMGKEGYSSIFVRGGDRGQDLVLLDGIKIYNTSHVGGFASLFNTDVVKHVDLYKGGFPAQFGGRASSIIDVATKDGNSSEPHFKASVGLLSSSAMIEMPLGQKATMLIAGRSSYYALFARNAKKEYEDNRTGEYYDFSFYDINAKLKWKLAPTQSLSLSALFCTDKMADGDGTGWYNPTSHSSSTYYNEETSHTHNRGVSLAYAIGIGNVYLRNTLTFSKYKSKYTTDTFNAANNIATQGHNETQTAIGDASLQSRIELTSGRHRLKGGIEIARYAYKPMLSAKTETKSCVMQDNEIEPEETTAPENMGGGSRSTQTDLYASDEIAIGDKTSLELGLRATIYHCKDTNFTRAEPRFALRRLISNHLSVKANYTVMNQYNHVVVERYMGFEREIWMAATRCLPPQFAQQAAIGLFYGDDALKLNASIEAFGKKMDNLIQYFPPASYEHEVANVENTTIGDGEGRSYGIEIAINKEFRRVCANISYTFSKSERRFEPLNGGRWFPSFYDRRHELTTTTTWDITDRWSLCCMFNLASGMPVTMPVGYNKEDNLMSAHFIYDGINNRRLPLYHRLDVSATYSRMTKRHHWHKWTVNVFNIYAHENATGLYYDSWSGAVKKVAMFSIMPSLNYTFEF